MFSLLEVVTSMNGSYQVAAPKASRKPLFCCPSLVSQTHILGGKCPLQNFNTFIKANKKSSVPKLAHKTRFSQNRWLAIGRMSFVLDGTMFTCPPKLNGLCL